MKNLWLLDANAILRYLLNDIPEQADATEQKLTEGAKILPEVLAEVAYVLQKVYNMERAFICECLLTITDLVQLDNKNVIVHAIRLFQEKTLDFVDCILIAYNRVNGIQVFSFDKKLNSFLVH